MTKNKKRSTFTSVDLWQKEFSRVSVAAVFAVFEKTFNIESSQMNKHSFQHCLESLRCLEKPDYKPHLKVTKQNAEEQKI